MNETSNSKSKLQIFAQELLSADFGSGSSGFVCLNGSFASPGNPFDPFC